METFNFPVYGTQGGGLARKVKGVYIFVESPKDLPSLCVGDMVPDSWGILGPFSGIPNKDGSRDQVQMPHLTDWENMDAMHDYYESH